MCERMNEEKIREAVRLFLEGIGEDPDREGLRDTPERVARMCGEIYGGLSGDAGEHLGKTFESDSGRMVLEKDIGFYSTCEHHLLPFYGKVHIAYVPSKRVVGLSKLARCVEVFARRPQIQERMTEQIADAGSEKARKPDRHHDDKGQLCAGKGASGGLCAARQALIIRKVWEKS